MQWWCYAQGTAWDWSWQAYPGVWVFIALLLITFRYATRSAAGTRPAFFLAGVAALWIALDWPVGALGAGYLRSLHTVQFLLIAHVAAPLLLLGLGPAVTERLAGRPALGGLLRFATAPVVALAALNVVVVITHLPPVLDAFMASPLGSLAVDMAWLAGGLLFWWPVVAASPHRPGFGPPLKMVYLFLNMVVASAPAAFLIFAGTPLYATYELAPPIQGISTHGDQQVAGFVMKFGGDAIHWLVIAILFMRWSRSEDELRQTAAPAAV